MKKKLNKSDETLRAERLAFYEADLDRIDACLDEFLKLSGARCAVLVDRDGHEVAKRGEIEGFSVDTIAALAAGSFAATKQMAKLIGEGQFSSLYHQGERDHLLIQLVGERSLLTIVFNEKTTLGMVRLYAVEAAKRLDAIYAEAATRPALDEVPAPLGDGFESSAGQAVDKLFEDR